MFSILCVVCQEFVSACPCGFNVKHDMDQIHWCLAKDDLGQMDAHKVDFALFLALSSLD